MSPFRLLAIAAAVIVAYSEYSANVRGDIIHVDDTAAGANDGTSWEDAFIDLHDGLAAAQAGDTVRIGQGTYKPAPPGGDRTISFVLVSGAVVQGGYAGAGSPDPNALDPKSFITILSGDLNGNDGPRGSFTDYGENSYHVVKAEGAGPDTALRGVTIRAGNAFDLSEPLGIGGGLLAINSQLALTSCIIEANRAWIAGAGVNGWPLNGPSTLAFTDCTIRSNKQVGDLGGPGGVLAGPGSGFKSCLFEDNGTGIAASGAALRTENATIDDCQFTSNNAGEDAGAIVGTSLTISNCDFIDNTSGFFGAALLFGASTLFNCRFIDNSSGVQGGAIRGTVAASECQFVGNRSLFGGAINGGGAFVNCLFEGNFTHGFGLNGGAILGDQLAPLDLVNCTFRGNSSVGYGGAVSGYALSTANCVFAGNSTQEGPGAALYSDGPSTLIDCTFAGNASATQLQQGGGAVHVVAAGSAEITNCIFWQNSSRNMINEQSQISSAGGAVAVNHSCVQGWTGALGGANNIGLDPLFVDGDGGDDQYGTKDDNLRLSAPSPCRDAGDNTALPNDDYDLDGDGQTIEPLPLDLELLPRIVNGVVDMGAHERQPAADVPCPGDLFPPGGDNVVNAHDLIAPVFSWGQCPSPPEPCPADVDQDGDVDVDDVFEVLISWGACP
ncbi:MAG: hypothetical protein L0219_05170 [Phycisphaerales bacterium]|nr:hypothetical protein [Phycisphaerales bacterium]